MNHLQSIPIEDPVEILNQDAQSSVVLVCEHASAHIPATLENLGVAPAALASHVVWDPGALPVAEAMASQLDAVLITSTVSRLVYDCNRPPEAHDAMPERSEVVDVPGNISLSVAEKAARVAAFYEPFRAAVSDVIAGKSAPILITVHSFTPVYHGTPREVEIGVLHDTDARLADAMLADETQAAPYVVQRNAPYGPQHGVTHTLREHALPGGHLNVMLEIRNDLIDTPKAQIAMAKMLSAWIVKAIANTQAISCKA